MASARGILNIQSLNELTSRTMEHGLDPWSRGVSAVSGSTEDRNLVRAHTTRGDTDRAVGRAREIRARPVRDAIRRADDPADVRPCKKRFQRLAVAHVRGWERGRAPAHGGTRGSRAHAHVTRSHTAHICVTAVPRRRAGARLSKAPGHTTI